ncbi:hypothetical protein D9M73_227280 [compost metagenome]
MLDIQFNRVDTFTQLTGRLANGVQMIQWIVGPDNRSQMGAETTDQTVVLLAFRDEIAGKGSAEGVERIERIKPFF